MKKFKCNINNLDCAGCAMEVQEGLNKSKIVKNAVVNFNTSKIIYEADEKVDIKVINKIVKSIEPDAFCSEDEVNSNQDYNYSILLLALICMFISYLFKSNDVVYKVFIIITYIVLLYKPFINAIKTLVKNHSLNENALIFISCVGAYFLGEHMEGIMVVLLYTIGKVLESIALNRARSSISGLINIKQDYANLVVDDNVKKVDVEDVKVGDILLIKKGEKVPVDGVVYKEDAHLDTSSLTGEADPATCVVGADVLSGSINVGNLFYIKVTKEYSNSTVARILDLVTNATDKKTKTENLVTKLSRIYTPIIMILAIITILSIGILTDLGWNEAVYRGLTFLVISCPCAIAISVPLSYFTGIGVSSKNGILIKGSSYLENLSKLDKIIFDKTGTLTNGSFSVSEFNIIDNKYKKDELLNIIASGEAYSNHPIAKSIVNLSNKIDKTKVKNYKEISGVGIEYDYGKKHVMIGSSKICKSCDISTDLHINIDGCHVASIVINDGIKDNVIDSINKLNDLGIETWMLTGDKKDNALAIAKTLGIKNVRYELLPEDKFSVYESIISDGIVAFVGDGVNDAPVLKRSDIGISMGSVGSEVAIDASDIVIMNDDISKINKAIDISKYMIKIIKENLIFALLVKVIILLLSVFGFATMWAAVFADTGVTLICILNSLRIMRK